jgi:hypothetical protein
MAFAINHGGDGTEENFKNREFNEYQEDVKNVQRMQAAQQKPHEPKITIEKRHRIILFGAIHRIDPDDDYASMSGEEIEAMWSFTHQRIDGVVTEGYIPKGFKSTVPLEGQQSVTLNTRIGVEVNEKTGEEKEIGPEFQVTMERNRNEEEEVGRWNGNADALWTEVLTHFEKKNLLSEDSLDYLDCDPFVLFGIDDTVTQKALKKLERTPALLCRESNPPRPNQLEWFNYLKCDPQEDADIEWVVQAFAEAELPTPWTCYKGIGSIVCYIKQDTGHVTWKHPFYDYFTQLRDFCYKASQEEIMKVRVNRLLWNYELSCSSTSEEHEPLISPDYIEHLADIFGYDVRVKPFLVRTLKAYLKVFARTYRHSQEIDMDDIGKCHETLLQDEEKDKDMHETWHETLYEETKFELEKLAAGRIECVQCATVALSFCLECKDYLCLQCYDKLHQKGARRFHAPFRLIPCASCLTMPAKLHCTFTDKSLCHECYAMRHIKTLPPDAKENPARRINYKDQYDRYASMAQDKQIRPDTAISFTSEADSAKSYESVLGAEWHPFYDARGVKYYHNFATCERMRQSPAPSPSASEDVSEAGDAPMLEGSGLPQEIFGVGDVQTEASSKSMLRHGARTIRPPHRLHVPHVIDEDPGY